MNIDAARLRSTHASLLETLGRLRAGRLNRTISGVNYTKQLIALKARVLKLLGEINAIRTFFRMRIYAIKVDSRNNVIQGIGNANNRRQANQYLRQNGTKIRINEVPPISKMSVILRSILASAGESRAERRRASAAAAAEARRVRNANAAAAEARRQAERAVTRSRNSAARQHANLTGLNRLGTQLRNMGEKIGNRNGNRNGNGNNGPFLARLARRARDMRRNAQPLALPAPNRTPNGSPMEVIYGGPRP